MSDQAIRDKAPGFEELKVVLWARYAAQGEWFDEIPDYQKDYFAKWDGVPTVELVHATLRRAYLEGSKCAQETGQSIAKCIIYMKFDNREDRYEARRLVRAFKNWNSMLAKAPKVPERANS
jgi:hypothetical protein